MNIMQTMNESLEIIINKLNNKERFSLIRPSDGEYLILKSYEFYNIDNWHFSPNINSMVKDDLYNSIKKAVTLENCYIGIPCNACPSNESMYLYYMNTFNIPLDKVTYANIFGTYNFKTIINFLIESKIPFNYIGPGTKTTELFNIQSSFIVDEYLLNKWSIHIKNEIMDALYKYVENTNGIYLFSFGPLAKIIIPLLHEKYHTRTFIDIGSPLDLFLKEKISRPYMNFNDNSSMQLCDFISGHTYELNNISLKI